jgi:hypothetical protein
MNLIQTATRDDLDRITRFQRGKASDIPPGTINRMKLYMELTGVPMLTWQIGSGELAGSAGRVLRVGIAKGELGELGTEYYYFNCNGDTLSPTENISSLFSSYSAVVQLLRLDDADIVRIDRKAGSNKGINDVTTPIYVNKSSIYQPMRYEYGNQVDSYGALTASQYASILNSYEEMATESKFYEAWIEDMEFKFRLQPPELPYAGKWALNAQPIRKMTALTTVDASYLPSTNVSYKRTNDMLYLEEPTPVYRSYMLNYWGVTYDCYTYESGNPYRDNNGKRISSFCEASPTYTWTTQWAINCYIYEVLYKPYGLPVSGTDLMYAGAKSPWGIVSIQDSQFRYGGADYINYNIGSQQLPYNDILNTVLSNKNLNNISFSFYEAA